MSRTRAQRRHHQERSFSNRIKIWVGHAISDKTIMLDQGLYFLKNTGKPCSCFICKRPRYTRKGRQPKGQE